MLRSSAAAAAATQTSRATSFRAISGLEVAGQRLDSSGDVYCVHFSSGVMFRRHLLALISTLLLTVWTERHEVARHKNARYISPS